MATSTSKTPVKKASTTTSKTAAKKPAAKTVAKPVAKSTATVKPAASKPAATKTAKPVAAPKKVATVVKKSAPKSSAMTAQLIIISDEQRYRMIAEAAYYRAERNHFKSDPVRDWIEAESEIACLLGNR